MTQSQVDAAIVRHKQTPNRPTVVFGDAPFDIVSVLEEHRVEYPGLIIQSSPKRYYPDSTAVSAFVGYTSEINEAELASDRGRGYKPGQQIGKAGLEVQYDSVLHGTEGSRFVEVDARQRVVRDAGVRAELPPVSGPPLHTNIDMDLQRFVYRLFADSLVGAAVAMEPATGAVLAIHSAPGPMVSGSHFLPKAPLLWVKWMPAWAVMSRKWSCSWAELAGARQKIMNHRDTESAACTRASCSGVARGAS